MSKEEDRLYHSYLLRIWRDDVQSGWYALLEDPRTGKTHGFSSIPALYQFIDSLTQPEPTATVPPDSA